MENKLSHTHKHTDGGFEKRGRRLWLLLLLLPLGGRGRNQEAKKGKKKNPLSFSLSRATLAASRFTQNERPLSLSRLLSQSSIPCSNAGRVQHHPHARAERRRRQVLRKLGPHGAGAAVRARDAAPDHAELGAALEGLGLVHVGEALFLVVFGLVVGFVVGFLGECFFLVLFRGRRWRRRAAASGGSIGATIAMGLKIFSPCRGRTPSRPWTRRPRS